MFEYFHESCITSICSFLTRGERERERHTDRHSFISSFPILHYIITSGTSFPGFSFERCLKEEKKRRRKEKKKIRATYIAFSAHLAPFLTAFSRPQSPSLVLVSEYLVSRDPPPSSTAVFHLPCEPLEVDTSA